jgi:aryl-alcohol dehydrogenase-like predicted oxidoreductase
MRVSAVSFGAWAIGSAWGAVDDADSLAALHRAVDLGVNFIDTADVYGDGRSERLIAQLKRERPNETIYVATKAGRRLPQQTPEGYSRENLTAWIERSLTNLNTEALDLVQLHCPPTPVYDMPEVFGYLDELVKAGKIRYYGVSVEKVEEALRAVQHPGVQSVQIIFNMFRLKPIDQFFPAAKAAGVGILARLPLASGLLTGKMTAQTHFEADDHRNYNREGERFDKGETFSGVPYSLALELVEQVRALKPEGASMAQFALRWCLMHDAVTCAIPGAKTPRQSEDNFAASDLPALSPEVMDEITALYDANLRTMLHPQW